MEGRSSGGANNNAHCGSTAALRNIAEVAHHIELIDLAVQMRPKLAHRRLQVALLAAAARCPVLQVVVVAGEDRVAAAHL